MPTLVQQIDRCLGVLLGLPLWASNRACDLQSFQFGARCVLPDRRGENREVGEFALHIQCAWRIRSSSGIIVGSRDQYYPRMDAETTESFNWDIPGNNLCDERVDAFVLNHCPLIVKTICSDNAGGFTLSLDGGFYLEVFPDDSLQGEYWRFFVPGSDQPHAVMAANILRED
jgi:hypothetical protein